MGFVPKEQHHKSEAINWIFNYQSVKINVILIWLSALIIKLFINIHFLAELQASLCPPPLKPNLPYTIHAF